MGIGASLFLIAVGAILTFGVNQDAVGWINIDVIGWILMLIGLFGLALTAFFWTRRRRTYVDEPTIVTQQPVVGQQPMVREQAPIRERTFREGEYPQP